jgi:cysteine-rich repeat protein
MRFHLRVPVPLDVLCIACLALALAACSNGGLSDHESSIRIGAASCGNGKLELGEACDDGNATSGDGCDVNCTATGCGNGIATQGEACDDGNTTGGDGCERGCILSFGQRAYVKPSNTGEGGHAFGYSLALSADGSTLAVGALFAPDAETGDGAVPIPGAVHVFTRSGSTWTQQAYLTASNPGQGNVFGISLALSADGSTLAVGASSEDSAATGVNGDQSNHAAPQAGAVYVFTRLGTAWSQEAYVKASNTQAHDFFGHSVALSADGSTLAVSAYAEDSAATGVNGDQSSNAATNAGAVYVFTRLGTTWSQEAYVKASNTGAQDVFGYSLALSADGSTLAVGASFEDSGATGINGDQHNEAGPTSGAVYVFTRGGTAWSQQAYVKASNAGTDDSLGYSVALSADGSILAASALGESSAATGAGGDQSDNSVYSSGAVYVFTRSGATWSQQEYLKASNPGLYDWFGSGLGLSADGSTLAVGAMGEASAATGVGGDQADDSAPESGAAYLFARSGTTWSQRAYVKASNTAAYDWFGVALALAGDGATLVVGASYEASAATGIDGDQSDDSAYGAGAAYLFR